MIEKTDVIIIGAGLMGLTASIALQSLGLSVRLLENHLPDLSVTSSRPISLSFGSQQLLQQLGVWPILAPSAAPILSVHVSEKGKMGMTRFSATEMRIPALGFVLPFHQLQKALYEKAGVITPITTLQSITEKETGVSVTVDIANDTQTFSADLLIAADGAESLCRDFLKIPYTEENHDETADIYALTLSEPHHHIAYERFTTQGVFAVLPLFEKNKAQLVWTHKNTQINLPDLNDLFEGRLSIQTVKKIASFPLKTRLAEKQTTHAAIIMGNAAHTIYPVAAQGFNLGLHDLKILLKILKNSADQNQKIHTTSVLSAYENDVQPHQKKIIKLTHSLTHWFDLPFIGTFRGLGLLALDIVNPLKRQLAKRMMGI